MSRHLTYANVIGTLALFIALGGGAYAATKLPRNSVSGVQVKNGSLLAKDVKKGQFKAGAGGSAGSAGAPGVRGLGGPAGAFGPQGLQGPKGDRGEDGQARAYASITSQGQVLSGSKGLTAANISQGNAGEYCINGLPFTPRVTLARPDILSNDLQPNVLAEVETPSGGHGGTNACKTAQAYVKILYRTITGAQGFEHFVRTGQNHGFYVEIN